MKTKIIYISGGEVFDVADIRTAFEEVRSTLGLSEDTVLFGVPTDSDDAGIMANDTINTEKPVETEPEIIPEEEKIIPILSFLSTEKSETIPEPIPQESEEISISEIDTEIPDESENSDDIEINVIDEIPVAEEVIETVEETPIVTEIAVITETKSDDEYIDTVITQELIIEETINIESAINDKIPETSDSDNEETLEQLLEKMTPLREDFFSKEKQKPVKKETEVSHVSEDVLLEKLATEFAEKQDSIGTSEKSEHAGKIGKLKNILPFKKAKREDSGIIGDLFGWAGIAANDDEFSMPDFFSGAASKK